MIIVAVGNFLKKDGSNADSNIDISSYNFTTTGQIQGGNGRFSGDMSIGQTSAPAAKTHIKNGSTDAEPIIELEQNDLDKPFAEFDGTEGSGTDIFDDGPVQPYTGVTARKLLHITVNGTTYSLIAYDPPPLV